MRPAMFGPRTGGLYRLTLRAALPIVVFTLASCSYGKSVPVIEGSDSFACERVYELHAGLKSDDVLRAIGPPQSRSGTPGRLETWHYLQRVQYGDIVLLLGVIPISRPHYFAGCEAELVIKSGSLVRGTLRKIADGPSGEHSSTFPLQ